MDFVDKKYDCENEEEEEVKEEKEKKRKEFEDRIREEAYKFKNSQQDKNRQKQPISPIIITDSQSQSTPIAIAIAKVPSNYPLSQSLFDDSQTISVHESTLVMSKDNEILGKQIDDLADMYRDLTHVEHSLEGDDEFAGVTEARKKRLEDPLVHVGKSLWDKSGAENGEEKEDEEEGDGISSFEKFEQRMHFLVDRAMEAGAVKDSQLDVMKAQFSDVVKVTGQMIEKHETYMAEIVQQTQQTNQMVSKLKEEVQSYNRKVEQLEVTIKERDHKLEQVIKQVKQSESHVSTQIDDVKKGIKELKKQKPTLETQDPTLVPSPIGTATVPTPAPTAGAATLAGVPESTAVAPTTIGPQPPPPAAGTALPATGNRSREAELIKEVVLVIADSNGTHLNPALLHDSKKVVIEERKSWEAALNHVPKLPNPDRVTDIILATGTLNVMRDNQPISSVLNVVDATGKKYHSTFPNATIHLGSIAPANERCVNYNFHLQGLAAEREAPFISTDGIFDERSGRVKPNFLNGMYFSKTGIRPFAKQIKRSLYDKRTKSVPTKQSAQPNRHLHEQAKCFPNANAQGPQWQKQCLLQPAYLQRQPDEQQRTSNHNTGDTGYHHQPQPQQQSNANIFGTIFQPQPQQSLEQQLGPNMSQALETFFKIARVCLPQ